MLENGTRKKRIATYAHTYTCVPDGRFVCVSFFSPILYTKWQSVQNKKFYFMVNWFEGNEINNKIVVFFFFFSCQL